jgi:hypothetical protein
LIASGGTNYLWTGPNGFTSYKSNNPNATALNSGQYSCSIAELEVVMTQKKLM